MKLVDIINCDGQELLSCYAKLERQVNDGSPSGESKTVSDTFSPKNGAPSFRLPYIYLDLTEYELIGSGAQNANEKEFLFASKNGQIKFYIHPDVARRSGIKTFEDGPLVFPTSSGRTVCTLEDDPPVFVKLHYDQILGRQPRKLLRRHLVEAAYFSSDLAAFLNMGKWCPKFCYFTEDLGVYGSAPELNYGFIIRDFNPRGVNPPKPDMPRIPLFSMYAREGNLPNPPLLHQWFELMRGRSSSLFSLRNLVFEQLLKPIVESYIFLATGIGFLGDQNAQNIILFFESDGSIRNVAFRDLNTFYLDTSIRKIQKLDCSLNRKLGTDSASQSEREYALKCRSVFFDHKFSEYVLMPIVNLFSEFSGDETFNLISIVKNFLRAHWPEIGEYFPGSSAFRVPIGPTKRDGENRRVFEQGEASPFR